MYRTIFRVVIFTILFISVYAQTTKLGGNKNGCESQRTCDDCINRSPTCSWCSEKDGSKPRCVDSSVTTKSKAKSLLCSNDINRKSSVEIEPAKPFSSVKDHQVQLMPQRVKMVLRRGERKSLKIKYKQAEDYPVDLYFLMDLSASMEKYQDNLASLGYKLAEAMRNLTSNFNLGFGSFVDKVLLPMTHTDPKWIEDNCFVKKGKCDKPYGYKNQLPLTNEINRFQSNVRAAPISANIDTPEGGLEALMQAMVCWKEIGWRDNARHIIVYSTDATYHIAGDGKLAGLVEPNDERCHLDAEGRFYTHAEILDYPSISQIRKQAMLNNINIIFAVANEPQVISTHETLSKNINGSSIGILDKNSDSVVSLIQQHYEDLTQSITMGDNATAPLEVKYLTRCLTNGKLQERKECGGVRVNTPLEFEVAIKAIDCPADKKRWRQTVEIKPQQVNERVIIDVEIICDCPCSRPGHKDYEVNSKSCTGSGDLRCGVCACNEGFYGANCNCEGDSSSARDTVSKLSCIRNDTVCSNRGTCICGACKCESRPNPDEKFYGNYCECDNFSCERHNGLICGGPTNGRCDCGECMCQPGLGGKACSCRTSNSTCIPPGKDTAECSGFGECICGSCRCTTPGRSGEFCENCPTCPSQRCDMLKDTVECEVHKSGPLLGDDGECRDTEILEIEYVDHINNEISERNEADLRNADNNKHICTVPDSSGCTFVFSYETKSTDRGDTDIPVVEAEKAKRCPNSAVSPYTVAGGAIVLTLFLGLIGLLIWKLLTMYHDHREWVKFEKERVCASWGQGENPLFKEPTTSFQNPTFNNVKG